MYTSEYDGYIGLSRYKLTPKPFDCPEEVSIQIDVSREKFGFTEITGFGHFFFCQTVYCLKERGRPLGQVIAGISSYPIPSHNESMQIRSIFGGDLLDTLYEIQATFNRHPDLPFLMAPLPSAPPAEPLAPSAPSALTPLPAERLCLALARDSIQQKEICPISQEVLTPGEIAVTACYCVFQAPLLTMWASTHNTCPACRTPLAFRIVTV